MRTKIYDLMEVPVEKHGVEFNRSYTKMLNHLQNSWSTGDREELESAINIMVGEMIGPARELMEKALPDGSGNFCPDFRLIAT